MFVNFIFERMHYDNAFVEIDGNCYIMAIAICMQSKLNDIPISITSSFDLFARLGDARSARSARFSQTCSVDSMGQKMGDGLADLERRIQMHVPDHVGWCLMQ
jgi:hypothetical protein